MPPLDGVTVVSFEQAVAAPFATRHLADLGARVIKVERPGDGDFARHYDHAVHGTSAYFLWLNRSKESIALDLRQSGADEVVARLVKRADVVVHNLAPDTAKRRGLDPGSLVDRHSRLIACGISGYGTSGPYARRKAYDLLVQAEAGILAVTGTERSPSKVGISIADIAAGMYAYASILAGLFHRERTGAGVAISVSLFDALVEWMSQPLYSLRYGGGAPPRMGGRHATIAPYGPYRTADTATIFIAVQSDREWRRFCELVLMRPRLGSDPRFAHNVDRAGNRRSLERMIQGAIGRMTAEALLERLETAGVASARMNTVHDVLSHPQLAARPWVDVGGPQGPVAVLPSPVKLEGLETRYGPVPSVGEHTSAILEELGLPADWLDT